MAFAKITPARTGPTRSWLFHFHRLCKIMHDTGNRNLNLHVDVNIHCSHMGNMRSLNSSDNTDLYEFSMYVLSVCMYVCISIPPLLVHYYSEAVPTTARKQVCQ